MKIQHADISMSSSRSYQEKERVRYTHETTWSMVFNQKIQDQLTGNDPSENAKEDALIAYRDTMALMREQLVVNASANSLNLDDTGNSGDALARNPLLDLIIEKMIAMDLLPSAFADAIYQTQPIRFDNLRMSSDIPVMEVKYQICETRFFSHSEQEYTKFRSDGKVVTESGETVDFVMGLDMKREFFHEETYQYVEEGVAQLIDPLIINLDGAMPELTDVRFDFDLNGDGETETLPAFGSGSGFLALDLNEDGRVTDGTELFGPSTGSGFEELRQYDMDNNDWIDENDSVFDRLSVWTPGEDDGDTLTSIRDKGIGAIYLNSMETSFDVKDSANVLAARIEKTGVVLNEDGTAVTIQELDYNPNLYGTTEEDIA